MSAIPVSDGFGFEHRWFSGSELYGDDFTAEQIAEWFADEEHGYASLYGAGDALLAGAGDASPGGAVPARHEYGYHALNHLHGFSTLDPARRFEHALGFGSNVGDELLPLLARIDRVTLLDSSDRFRVERLGDVPVRYVLARPDGSIALPDQSVDLVTCFGVLHHIPNVSRVIGELHRVLCRGGTLLVREPTTTLGDWRRARIGLTPRERGIPRHFFQRQLGRAGFRVRHEAACYFPPWVRLCGKLGVPVFDNALATRLDALFARASVWNDRYHRTTLFSRFAPASLFVVAERGETALKAPTP